MYMEMNAEPSNYVFQPNNAVQVTSEAALSCNVEYLTST
jgi:hypothetical protein